MAKNYEGFYSGGYSSLSPSYGNFIGYRLNANTIGAPMNPQTANQINEVVSRIREGIKNVEIGAISPDVFDQIPKEQFKEIAALTKLTGVKASMHAPIIDPAGFGERGYEGDLAREDAERRLFEAVKRSHELDPTGNVPIAVHSTAGIPGNEYRPDKDKEPGEEGRFKEHKLILIDQESHEMTGVKEERKYYPRTKAGDWEKGGTLRIPRDEIDSLNATDWDQKLTNLAFYKKEAEEVMSHNSILLGEGLDKPVTPENFQKLDEQEKASYNKVQDANLFLDNVRMSFDTLFNRAYKYGTDEQKEQLRKLAEEYTGKSKELYVKEGDYLLPTFGTPLKTKHLLDESIRKLHAITSSGAPQVFKPVEDFAMDKAAETFGNVAFKAYDKFGKTAPILAIENMFQGMAFSRAEDLKKLVEKAQDKFVEKAKEEGYGEGEAEQMAKKLIGVTWDVGHLNMMKKHGFKDEDVVEETKKIAKNVKHVHLTDNFGYSDSHLPPGMGNVPLKKILEELEKTGRLGDMRKIVEAGGFVQQFKKSPHPFVLQAFGSPIYGAKMAPYWNQTADVQGGYFGFPMAYMPEKHFSMYGSGFSLLPEELGGQMPGTQSRFSGAANA